ncbi:MAG: bifunctional folylpolyglutamate synthase/dihydrofolate synthase, partial [Clostridiales bacterium]|nr:bifunctional folylpolyglutamate synthase/dihydrofolate synthase [Clostridiales bacterium]
MNYIEAIKYIEGIGKFGMNFGLDRIKRLCELLGNPQDKLKIIHVAGTNGKGSTTTFISNILISQGYNVGTYTSPYLERFTERIKINNNEILEDDVVKLVENIKPAIETVIKEGFDHPTEFEIITACAFKYFYEKQVDFVVLEVGLGGRLDATNVVKPIVSVITSISYDHMNILGDTLSKIAAEKAGIIKENIPLVLYPQQEEVREVILNIAKDKNSKVYNVSEAEYQITNDTVDGIVFNLKFNDNTYKNLKITMINRYQVLNAITAILTIKVLSDNGYDISDESIYTGLANSKWPGRFEVVHKNPYIILDGGHNIQGVEELVKGLKNYFTNKKIKIVCGMLKDKDYISMIKEMSKVSSDFIAVTPNNPRALTANELSYEIEKLNLRAIAIEDISEATEFAINTKYCDVLVFCGSLYLIGEVRKKLKLM